ncbi:hypothetical protein [Dictyobacter arantiisoli]|uniref:Uncharacterized protein n=1 Tax=Dictyobacter arantiisoli TaxID=2014874 RepID=A0A5A5T6Y7_9CHLR|nr:hypothetical protein [Dictyobacter arantiisoli]GCF06946.1 hypothetical protein KDI_05100 [Dictyobacter arantiisoli]
MKKNDSGDFSVFYIEPGDEKATLFPILSGQQKPVVLMLADGARAIQRPDDFTALKHLKRQYNLTLIFVIEHSAQLKQLAIKNGFPVYESMEQLIDAVRGGQAARQRSLNRSNTASLAPEISTRTTRPLPSDQTTGGESAQPVAAPGLPLRPAPVFVPLPQAQNQPHYMSQPSVSAEQKPLLAFDTQATQASNQFTPAPGQLHREVPFAPRISPDLSVQPPPPEPIQPAPPAQARVHTKPVSKLLAFVTIALILGILGSFLVFSRSFTPGIAAKPTPSAPAAVGRVTFTSSGQVNETSSQGIADQVVLDLHGIPNPAANKKYYAWLLADKSQSDPMSIALGALTLTGGKAHLQFAGDNQHSNLLALTSRILITEEDAHVPPISPSLNTQDWRYYGEFSATPIPATGNAKPYSYLDHLRHLLSSDPTLEQMELPGGLNNWLYRNTSKLVEWTGSMRETWENTKDTAFIQRQTLRVLAYLDGTTFLYKDLPAKSPLLVNERLARIGLLDVNGPDQLPPDYMDHVNKHLRGLLQASNPPAGLRQQVTDLTVAMDNIELWLTQVRSDAQKLMKMTPAQMRQPVTLSIINDMIDNANRAFAGQADPSTGQTREGVSWLHDHMQLLATLDLKPISAKMSSDIPQILPNQVNGRVMVPFEVKR